MADEPEDIRTLKQKLLFYTTAFFILLGTFSLFAFLFLVPFVIDPAFTTIFMQFDTTPALCFTVSFQQMRGMKNCSWTSCKEGCTKELFECQQILVNYKLGARPVDNSTTKFDTDLQENSIILDDSSSSSSSGSSSSLQFYSSYDHHNSIINNRLERSNRGVFDYIENQIVEDPSQSVKVEDSVNNFDPAYIDEETSGLAPNTSEWHFFRARLYPNVKGCGYPPYLNCTIWRAKYSKIGTNYSCYYSQIDPKVVITDLDLHQNMLNLIYAMAIPIPSFIASIIYLTYAYFKIYNDDEEPALLDRNAEDTDGVGEEDGEENAEGIVDGDGGLTEKSEQNCNVSDIILQNGSAIVPTASGPITPNSDLASFGHQLKVKMVDEMSRDSIDGGLLSNSGSIQGNLSKTMTTSISTPPGPIAAV